MQANGCDAEAKTKKLPTLLEGEALAAWLELTSKENYDEAEKLIKKPIMPMNFVSLDEFHHRRH